MGDKGLLERLFSSRQAEPVEPQEPPIEPQEEPAQPTLSLEELAVQLQIPELIEAVRAVDGLLESQAKEIAELKQVVTTLAEKETVRIKKALEGGSWLNQLFSASRDGEPAGEQDQEDAQPVLPKEAAESPGAYLLGQSRVK